MSSVHGRGAGSWLFPFFNNKNDFDYAQEENQKVTKLDNSDNTRNPLSDDYIHTCMSIEQNTYAWISYKTK